MRLSRALVSIAVTVAFAGGAMAVAAPAGADSAAPSQSMTHIKTAPGIASTLEGRGVILFGQGGATTGLIGDSPASPTAQVVFHVPITGAANGVRHKGSTLLFVNTTNDRIVQLQNPVIDLRAGVVRATVPQVGGGATTVLTIANAAALKPKVTTMDGVRTTTYTDARLVIAPGVGEVLSSALGLPAGSLPDGTLFATAEVTLYAKAR